MDRTLAELLKRFRRRERPALARAISLVEDAGEGFEDLLHEVRSDLGRARRLGLTGPPGAGKSTLAAQLAVRCRTAGEQVGIIAVDPTSPFTGGALLGDRIRMSDIFTDTGVFIRSMATRGSLGGLATTTGEVADLMDAFGFERVMIETVGVGQSELEIARAADTTVVVLVPESGDSVQAMKAGLMEIADIFVVNKSDRPGAGLLVRELDAMLGMRASERRIAEDQALLDGSGAEGGSDAWAIPVVSTAAETGEGVDDLLSALDRHTEFLVRTGELEVRRRRRLAQRTRAVVERELSRLTWRVGPGARILEEALPALESGAESPYSVAARIVHEARREKED